MSEKKDIKEFYKKEDLEMLKKLFPEAKGDSLQILMKIIEGKSRINLVKFPFDLKDLLKKFSKELTLDELNSILDKVIKNEQFVDFIQDLFLEKLL
jgi:hypothetical protein